MLTAVHCSKGWHVIMGCRDRERGMAALKDVKKSLRRSLSDVQAAMANVELEILDMVSLVPPSWPGRAHESLPDVYLGARHYRL